MFDLEQAIQQQVTQELLTAVLNGGLNIEQLLSDHFVRDLHGGLYGDIWSWAGKFRTRELNIGVATEQISVDLRSSLDSIAYRWGHAQDWTARQLAITAHAEIVRVHPFVDGNGRTSRLLADLILVAASDDGLLQQFDWDVEKSAYITLLRDYDVHRDGGELTNPITVRDVEG